MKKKSFFLILLALLAGSLVLLLGSRGDVSQVQRTIGNSQVYTRQDVEQAMDVTESYFRTHFEGCKLLTLQYDAKWRLEEEERAESYGMDQVIVLTSSYYVEPKGASPSLNPDFTYQNWKWILARNGNGNWVHKDHGYG